MGTPMTAVTGIGPAAATVLAAHGFDSAEALADCSIAALVKVPGFGAIRAATIKEAAQAALKTPASAGGKKGKKEKKKKKSGKGKMAAKSKSEKGGGKKSKKTKKGKRGKAKGKKAKGRKKR